MDYVEYDGTERGIEDLLLFWGKHSNSQAKQVMGKEPDRNRGALWFTYDLDGSERILIEKGDRIYWREFEGFYLIKSFPMPVYDDPEDSFAIKDRGVMFSSSKWKTPPGMWEPWDLSGEIVKLCGKEVKVRGVETFMNHRSRTSPYRNSFCLLISFEDAKEINDNLRNGPPARG